MTVFESLNRLAKWRTFFAGWQLGTRPKGDPECDAVRDHREATLLLRAEVSALTQILLNKKVFTLDEYDEVLKQEAENFMVVLETSFPGVKATDEGLEMDARVLKTMEGWKP